MSLGAYVLPGDPVWLRSTMRRTYPMLDRLVVPVPRDGLGWRGRPIPVEECLSIVREADSRGILTVVEGCWIEPSDPLAAETGQRQAALDELAGTVDWALQLDGDELLLSPESLYVALSAAEEAGLDAVELPMQVLYRRLRDGRYLAITDADGEPVHEYPAPVAVRPTVTLAHARRTAGPFLRAVVHGDDRSLQVSRPPETGEHRVTCLATTPVLHNSWARTTRQTWRKTRSWGHAADLRMSLYVASRWFPAARLWRRQHDLHPFSSGLWPAVRPLTLDAGELHPADR